MNYIQLFEAPLSWIAATGFFLACCLLSLYFSESKCMKFIGGRKLTLVEFVLIGIALAVEGTWKLDLHHHPLFLLLSLVTMLSLSQCIVSGIRNKSGLSFLLAHIGFYLIIFGAFFGSPDFVSASVIAKPQESTHLAFAEDGSTIPLPFEISLESFSIDYYDDDVSPKQYTSELIIDGQRYTTSVNHPCFHKGYYIYQSDYGHGEEQYSVLKLVRDPWLFIVYLGIVIIALGAILGLKGIWNSPKVILAAIALAIVFGFISMARIKLGTLMPALRSLWFVPHLIIYMLSYSLLAIAFVLCIAGFFVNNERQGLTAYKLLATSSSLLLIGMLCGAVWAKSAWGDYWTWDAKECWAAATWMLTLAGTHVKNRKAVPLLVILSFLAIQVTWYGVNYLPSSEQSMHTYNNQ